MDFGLNAYGGVALLLAIGLGLLWALWTAWSGGALKRWVRDWSVQASQKFAQPSSQVAPPQVTRAKAQPGDHGRPDAGAAAQPPRHRSGQRHN